MSNTATGNGFVTGSQLAGNITNFYMNTTNQFSYINTTNFGNLNNIYMNTTNQFSYVNTTNFGNLNNIYMNTKNQFSYKHN